MTDLIKKILAICTLIGVIFSGYFFIESTYASKTQHEKDISMLAKRADNTDLGLKIIILQDILDRKRVQLREAERVGAEELAASLRDEISDLEGRIKMLEKKALE